MPNFDPKKLKLTHRLTFEGDWPVSVAFVDDDQVAAGNRRGDLFVWDLTGEPVAVDEKDDKKKDDKDAAPNVWPTHRLIGHDNVVTRLVSPHDGKTLISCSYDRTVRVWDTTAKPVGAAEVVLDAESRAQRGKRDKAALEAQGVKVHEVEAAHVLGEHKDWITAMGLSGDGKRLITGDDGCETIVWDVATRKPVSRWMGHAMTGVCSAALSPDGKTAFTAEYRFRRGDFDRPPAQVRFWDADTGKESLDVLKVLIPDVKDEDRVNSYGYGQKWSKIVGHGLQGATFSPDGKLLAAGQGGETNKGEVHLIDVATGKIVRTFADHKYGVCDVRFSPDGAHVISSGRDTTVQVHTTADSKEVAKLNEPRGGQFKDWLSALALSPDGTRLAAADIAGMVHVWSCRGAG